MITPEEDEEVKEAGNSSSEGMRGSGLGLGAISSPIGQPVFQHPDEEAKTFSISRYSPDSEREETKCSQQEVIQPRKKRN